MKEKSLALAHNLYKKLITAIVFQRYQGDEVDVAHHKALEIFAGLDNFFDNTVVAAVMGSINKLASGDNSSDGQGGLVANPNFQTGYRVGGAYVQHRAMLAAGLIKEPDPRVDYGPNPVQGVRTEDLLLEQAEAGINMLTGLALHQLDLTYEVGSLSRWPRAGNDLPVVGRYEIGKNKNILGWNRVGLRNAGIKAVVRYLEKNIHKLPTSYGINVTPTTEEERSDVQISELVEFVEILLQAKIYPNWLTLNVSCPTTESDQQMSQEKDRIQDMIQPLQEQLTQAHIPLWVKLGPVLEDDQYRELVELFADLGVKAVVLSNTLPETIEKNGQRVPVGLSGPVLHEVVVDKWQVVSNSIAELGLEGEIDLVACGGITPDTIDTAIKAGADAVQAFAAFVYGGPFAFWLMNEKFNKS